MTLTLIKKELKPSVFSLLSILIVLISKEQVDGACSFPANLTGNWISADRGLMTFHNATHLAGYKAYVENLNVIDFNCIEQQDNRYLLQAVQFINFFGKITRFYLCLQIEQISDNVYKYFIGTVKDPYLRDYLFGLIDVIATMQDACNRYLPYETQTYVLLVREGAVEAGTASVLCPDLLLARFQNVTLTRDSVTENCENTTLDVCTNRYVMSTTFGDTCTKQTFSSVGQQTCVHYITTNGITYLTVWNNGTVARPTTFQFSCYALEKKGTIVYATETPMFCSNLTTPTNPGTQLTAGSDSKTTGHVFEYKDITETCLTAINATTTAAPAVEQANLSLLWILMGLLLIPLIILLYCLFKKVKCPKPKPKPRPPTPDIDVRKGEICKRKSFGWKADFYRKANGMDFSLFRQKKPLPKVFPLFDPEWDTSTLPFVLPLPRVDPMYSDPVEMYMRDRLPRSKSTLSAYSFDSIIINNKPIKNGFVTHK